MNKKDERTAGRHLRSITATAATFLLSVAVAQPIISTKTVSIYERPEIAASKPTGRVAGLIRGLSDGSLPKRLAAEQALLKMGLGIEPQLQWALNEEAEAVAANDRKNPAVQQTYMRGFGVQRFPPDYVLPRYGYHHLSVLIDHLEERRRAASTRLTLHYTDAPVAEVLREVGRQLDTSVSMGVRSGYRMPSEKELDWVTASRMTIREDRASYWNALRVIVDQLAALAPQGGAEQYLQIGFDRVYLAPSLNGRNFTSDRLGSVVSGPMRIDASTTTGGATVLTLRAAVEPGLTGLNRNAMVRVTAITDDLGQSLLAGDGRLFVSKEDDQGYVPSDGFRTWKVEIPLNALGPGRRIGTVRGQFGIGTAPPQQSIAVPLASAAELQAAGSVEEIFVSEDCRILNSPGGDGGPYRSGKNICRLESSRNARQDTARLEQETMVLTNDGSAPVNFVVSKWLFGGRIVSEPKPVQVAGDTAVFRVHADAGETIRLHIGVRYERRGRVADTTARTEAAEGSVHMDQVADFDGWVMTVRSIARTGELYSVSGELSRPIDSPAGQQGIYLYLGLADGARWSIVNKDRTVTERKEGDRLITEWTVKAAEAGRVPATLMWDTPEATRWLTVPFEVHDVPVAAGVVK